MSSSHENLSPQVLQCIARELRKMVQRPLEGIRIRINEEDITDIQADISGPEGTPYEGGTFRCKLVLGSEFPAAPPRGFFLTKIFHPNISANGDICVNTLKKDWKSDLGMTHVLQVIRCLLIVPFPMSALNEDASKMFLDSYDEYFKRAKLLTSIHATRKLLADEEEDDEDGSIEGAAAAGADGVSRAEGEGKDGTRESKDGSDAAVAKRRAVATDVKKKTKAAKAKMDRRRNLKRL